MTSAKRRAANRANALKSTGPKTTEGKQRASINATRHTLSVPVSEVLHGSQIKAVSELIRSESQCDLEAIELSKRIVDFERNEAHQLAALVEDQPLTTEEAAKEKLDRQIIMQMSSLLNMHEQKKEVPLTFTTSSRHLSCKERSEEKQYIKDYLSLQRMVAISKERSASSEAASMLRYHKRSVNQLLKGLREVAESWEI